MPVDSNIKDGFVVVTTNYVSGKKIAKTLGPTFGIVVRSRGIGGNIVANLRTIVGGEINEYTKMLTDARENAIDRMVSDAREMGANGVIGMQFDSADIGNIMTEVVAYGTAVVLQDDASKSSPVSLR